MAEVTETGSGLPRPLTLKEQRFVEEYAADPNATRAYRKAFPGVTYGSARTLASRLLTKVDILAEVAAAREQNRRNTRVSAARTLRELARVAYADPDDLWAEGRGGMPELRSWGTITPTGRRTIRSIKIKRKRLCVTGKKGDDATEWEIEDIEVKQHSKTDALDKLCRHLGLTTDGAALEKLLAQFAGSTGTSDTLGVPCGRPPTGRS